MILVIGDAMQDEYWFGESTRLSPEAPVPIVSIKRTELKDGGAANVANNIEAMGVPVKRLFGSGQKIRKVRLMSGTHHVARIDYDHPQNPIPLNQFSSVLEGCSMVVAVDYGKGSLEGIQALIQAANVPVLVDPKGSDWERYRGAALIKPNRHEMYEEPMAAITRYRLGAILLTQAGDGMTLFTHSRTRYEPSTNANPVDVSGAGEAALAAYAVATVKGLDPMPYAAKAAGIAISRFGTTVCTEGEVFGTG